MSSDAEEEEEEEEECNSVSILANYQVGKEDNASEIRGEKEKGGDSDIRGEKEKPAAVTAAAKETATMGGAELSGDNVFPDQVNIKKSF